MRSVDEPAPGYTRETADPTSTTSSGAAPHPAPAVPRRCASISCVVPCYNERENLGHLLPLLQDTLRGCCSRWEIVVVDDGGTDGTVEMLRRQRPAGVRVVELSRNFGKEAALTAGLAAARGSVVVLLDADLQHPPELIPAMLEHWRQGYDVAYAQRRSRQSETLVKRVGTWIFYRLIGRSHRFRIPPGAGDFRLLDRHVVDALLALPENNRMMKGLFAWVGYRSIAVPFEPSPRFHGRSTYRLRQLTSLSVAGITSFTTWPLRMVSYAGLAVSAMATTYGLYLLGSYLFEGSAVAGWTTLSVTLMLSVGLQLLALGVVGEYIGRIYHEVKRRPLYIVRSHCGAVLDGAGSGDPGACPDAAIASGARTATARSNDATEASISGP